MMLQAPKIYQVKITLNGIEPTVWRELRIPSDLFLHDFHKVIQTTMGWENGHLHQFMKNGRIFGFADDEPESRSDKFMDYTSIRVMDILKKDGETIRYLYDFGDYWMHEIILEAILEPDADVYYPICIDGARNCPPEDCGGPPGYQEMMKIFNHPGHPDREMLLEWLDEEWEPEEFDRELVNDLLMDDDFGCLPGME
ncbi:plasmid pRiA4b ORF-3 family protein [Alkalitalea saponilacus]|uniref:PRiA4b ORF-3-like protein n=1 Tax=Alkalitalea saponilacus TaxID=889453 RepID=A0A1T5G4R9_9BACT|nr:plasmid pRiA4b ORF-3 family protein [Alkalitalea saponilacus]ASB47853.1 hypothetical protein CDL62_01155 [Alkalitalea saponilacus]SKC03418.1 pRiA4b ORF-3-like protein [Alkalitalea saponilacus]